jgi:hypothetical protein
MLEDHVAHILITSNASSDAPALSVTLDQTVSALKGDVPEGSLERLDEKPLFNRRLECVDERASPSAMSRVLYMTRRSEAKPR